MGSFLDNPFQRAALLGLLTNTPHRPPATTLLGLSIWDPVPGYRSRQEWNERFAHWERSESDAETQRIERVRNMVEQALGMNSWLASEGARIIPQGSFTNRTNTRLDADIDLRVQHPVLKLQYDYGVNQFDAYREGGYYSAGSSYGELNSMMRSQIGSQLIGAFGRAAVDLTGKKAIRVKGLDGSRGEVDVVPCFTLHHIRGQTILGRYTANGTAILSTVGKWTLNYPDHHAANGIAKRLSTKLQFKRVVRIVKRLRADMTDRGILKVEVPSFLVECLVYLAEDQYFTVESDDRYDRVKRVLRRVSEILDGGLYVFILNEINGIKPLFGSDQAWTLDNARSFVKSAVGHLGDA